MAGKRKAGLAVAHENVPLGLAPRPADSQPAGPAGSDQVTLHQRRRERQDVCDVVESVA